MVQLPCRKSKYCSRYGQKHENLACPGAETELGKAEHSPKSTHHIRNLRMQKVLDWSAQQDDTLTLPVTKCGSQDMMSVKEVVFWGPYQFDQTWWFFKTTSIQPKLFGFIITEICPLSTYSSSTVGLKPGQSYGWQTTDTVLLGSTLLSPLASHQPLRCFECCRCQKITNTMLMKMASWFCGEDPGIDYIWQAFRTPICSQPQCTPHISQTTWNFDMGMRPLDFPWSKT